MTETPIAIVTGGAQGIGYASAEALREDGFRIVVVDTNAQGAQEAAERLGGGSVALPCDMGKADQISALFDTIEADIGTATVLVNNAGVSLPGKFLEYSPDDFNRVISVNLTGVFLATQRAAKAMIAKGVTGSIINMSSINAQLAISTIPAYCASKGGVMQITKTAAIALAQHGIRVNAVGPGSIDTAMMAGVNASPEALQTALARTPLGRVGKPREIGDVVAFLASDKASYITGETIYIDGGRLGLNYLMPAQEGTS